MSPRRIGGNPFRAGVAAGAAMVCGDLDPAQGWGSGDLLSYGTAGAEGGVN